MKKTLEEACVQILTPHRRVDILRDALEAKQKNTPYVVTFCGVNGVGKSTNLAKVEKTVCMFSGGRICAKRDTLLLMLHVLIVRLFCLIQKVHVVKHQNGD